MTDTTGKRIAWMSDIDGELREGIDVDRIHTITTIPGGVRVHHLGADSEMTFDVTLLELIAKLNAALNPPGPGDVTVGQICDALKELPSNEQSDYAVSISENGCCILGDGEEILAHSNQFNGNILAAIASLKPDPRDELRERFDKLRASHGRVLRNLKLLHGIVLDASDGAPLDTASIIVDAEKLEGKS